MPLEIAPATEEDAPALAIVSKAAFDSDARTHPGIEPGGPPGYDSADVLRSKIAEHTVFSVRLDGAVVGGIVVQDQGGGTLHLDLLFVDPARHNLGIGSAAMAFLDRSCPASRWTLQTPIWATRNRHFYEKFGFRKVGETVAPDITLVDYERWEAP
jgi:GNAT superfamily N-acetyltransferase